MASLYQLLPLIIAQMQQDQQGSNVQLPPINPDTLQGNANDVTMEIPNITPNDAQQKNINNYTKGTQDILNNINSASQALTPSTVDIINAINKATPKQRSPLWGFLPAAVVAGLGMKAGFGAIPSLTMGATAGLGTAGTIKEQNMKAPLQNVKNRIDLQKTLNDIYKSNLDAQKTGLSNLNAGTAMGMSGGLAADATQLKSLNDMMRNISNDEGWRNSARQIWGNSALANTIGNITGAQERAAFLQNVMSNGGLMSDIKGNTEVAKQGQYNSATELNQAKTKEITTLTKAKYDKLKAEIFATTERGKLYKRTPGSKGGGGGNQALQMAKFAQALAKFGIDVNKTAVGAFERRIRQMQSSDGSFDPNNAAGYTQADYVAAQKGYRKAIDDLGNQIEGTQSTYGYSGGSKPQKPAGKTKSNNSGRNNKYGPLSGFLTGSK